MMVRQVLQRVLDLFYEPLSCPACGAEGSALCPDCLQRLEPWGPYQENGFGGWGMYYSCKTPQILLSRLSTNRSFSACGGLSVIMDKWLQEEGAQMLREERFDLIVPVPSGPSRIRQTGFDPSVHLARHLSQMTGIPVLLCAKRLREGRNKRAAGPDQTFALKAGLSARLTKRSVLVFSDIHSSDGTLDALCRLIALASAQDVRFLTLQRAGL